MIEKKFGIDFQSSGGALTLSEEEVNGMSQEDGYWMKTHSDGWTIEGRITEDYYTWVNEFDAFHPKFGRVYGDFEKSVFADSQEGFLNFWKHHTPNDWDYQDI